MADSVFKPADIGRSFRPFWVERLQIKDRGGPRQNNPTKIKLYNGSDAKPNPRRNGNLCRASSQLSRTVTSLHFLWDLATIKHFIIELLAYKRLYIIPKSTKRAYLPCEGQSFSFCNLKWDIQSFSCEKDPVCFFFTVGNWCGSFHQATDVIAHNKLSTATLWNKMELHCA